MKETFLQENKKLHIKLFGQLGIQVKPAGICAVEKGIIYIFKGKRHCARSPFVTPANVGREKYIYAAQRGRTL